MKPQSLSPSVSMLGIKDLIMQWAKERALRTFRALFGASAWAFYDGPRMHDLPDLLIYCKQDAPIRAGYSPKIGKLTKRHQSGRSGDHLPEGMIYALSRSLA